MEEDTILKVMVDIIREVLVLITVEAIIRTVKLKILMADIKEGENNS
jgi:hypothetical protein